MQEQHQRSPTVRQEEWCEARTSRFNLPVRHPGVWRFLLDQLLEPAFRIHRYRNLSVRTFEDTLRKMDGGCCE